MVLYVSSNLGTSRENHLQKSDRDEWQIELW